MATMVMGTREGHAYGLLAHGLPKVIHGHGDNLHAVYSDKLVTNLHPDVMGPAVLLHLRDLDQTARRGLVHTKTELLVHDRGHGTPARSG